MREAATKVDLILGLLAETRGRDRSDWLLWAEQNALVILPPPFPPFPLAACPDPPGLLSHQVQHATAVSRICCRTYMRCTSRPGMNAQTSASPCVDAHCSLPAITCCPP